MPVRFGATFHFVFRAVLLLSGWAVALWLIGREPNPVPPQEVAPPLKSAEGKVARAFREWSEHAELEGAAIGFALFDEGGDIVFASPLAQTALCPASSLKTVTTATALAILGPEFRFTTTLASSVALNAEGLLEGDLVLVGGGDPTLDVADLEALADAVVQAGLRRITGRLRVDASIFPEHPMSDFWNWGDIGNAYGAGAYGLNLAHNRMTITFDPGSEPGAPAQLLGGEPALRETRWENLVTTGTAGSGDEVVVYSQPYGRTVTLRGTVPAGEKGFTVGGAIPDPPALAAELLRARLEHAGVVFTTNAEPSAKAAEIILARHESAPLPEIIDHLHRVSDNLEAQCLFLTIGLRQKAKPAEAVRAYWEQADVPFAGLRLLDGSGLARANMIRPWDLALVNYRMRHSTHGDRFYASLSQYLDGAVHAKRGAMSGVKTEVGFLRTASGREWTFALMANGLRPGLDFWSYRTELLAAVQEGN